MDKKFMPEKYGMMACPICDGQGRICSPDDVKVCLNCGGFGFIRKERETYVALKMDPILTQRV
jgi:DnaJ-class molecular chaperone